jgi:predicted TIM-barrel fold metal-dependent hydrolase
MMIVDSQVHIWAENSPERPWPPGTSHRLALMGHREKAIGYEELRSLMDEAEVNRALIVPPSWEGDRVDLGLEAAHKYPDRFAVMARIPLEKPDEAKALLKSWEKEPGIKGTRLTFHRDQDRPWLTDGTADWYWPYAEAHGIPTMVHAPERKPQLAAIAARHPNLRIIVDHMGIMGPHSVDDGIAPWIDGTVAMAKYPNVYVKVSAVPGYSSQPYPHANLNKYVQKIVRAFGPERCFWGSDLSRMLEKCKLTYGQCVEQFSKHMDFLSDTDKDWVMGRAICACLNWLVK